MRTTAPFGLALAGLLALVGCTATPAATPTPAPTPSFTCTPEAGGAGYACDQRSYDEMVAKDALYAEAEQVYRKFFAEDNRIQLTGDYRITPIIAAATAGAYLKALEEVYAQLDAMKVRASSGVPQLVWVRRQPGVSRDGSVVAIETCVDATGVSVIRDGKAAGHGLINRNVYYFSHEGESLKIVNADGSQVDKC